MEFALVLPAVVLVLGLVLASFAWALAAARAQQAAAQGARAAIVEADGTAVALAERAGGAPARLARADGWVTVCVTVPARGLVPAGERCASVWDAP